MTPLEIAAKAVGDTFDGQPGWTERCARAALLALSDAPLPGQVLNVGAMALTLEGPQRIKASQAFSAMLRKIAEARP